MRVRYLVAAVVMVVAVIAVVWTSAQVLVEKVPPTVLSGDDVGFRVEGLRGGTTPVGRIVVRINGQWVAAELAGGVGPALSTR